MPKVKTNRGAAKRFKRTGGGKLKRSHSMRRHILTKKGRNRKRRLRRPGMVDHADAANIRKLLPN